MLDAVPRRAGAGREAGLGLLSLPLRPPSGAGLKIGPFQYFIVNIILQHLYQRIYKGGKLQY